MNPGMLFSQAGAAVRSFGERLFPPKIPSRSSPEQRAFEDGWEANLAGRPFHSGRLTHAAMLQHFQAGWTEFEVMNGFI